MSTGIRIKKSHLGVFGVSLLFFIFIAVFKLKAPASGQELVLGYLIAWGAFLWSNPVTGTLLLIIIGLWVYRDHQNILVIPTAMVSALVLVAMGVYLNLCLITLGPNRDLVADRQEIAGILAGLGKPPAILVAEINQIPEMVISKQLAAEGMGTFFGQFVTGRIPAQIVPVNIPDSRLYLLNGELIFTGLNPDDLMAISPRLGYLFLKNYFSPRLIKADATVGILNRQDYLKLREDQIGSQLSGIDAYSTKVDKLYTAAAKTVSDDEDGIKTSQAELASATKSYNLELGNCQAAGYNDIFVHKFIRYHDDNYCLGKAQLDWGDKVNTSKQTINTLTAKLSADQKNLDSVNYIKTVVANYRSVVAAQMNGTPEELGLFHDQTKIDIVLDYINARSVPAYLQTLVHEYLHYASFVSDQRVLPTAFEEGLTEYYAREVIKSSLGKEMILGYPLLVKIIQQMATKIPADQLQNIYFTKDEALLSKLLDFYFGQNFYEDNSVQFEILPYLPPDKAVETANLIMSKIGGQAVTGNDLYSELNPKD